MRARKPAGTSRVREEGGAGTTERHSLRLGAQTSAKRGTTTARVRGHRHLPSPPGGGALVTPGATRTLESPPPTRRHSAARGGRGGPQHAPTRRKRATGRPPRREVGPKRGLHRFTPNRGRAQRPTPRDRGGCTHTLPTTRPCHHKEGTRQLLLPPEGREGVAPASGRFRFLPGGERIPAQLGPTARAVPAALRGEEGPNGTRVSTGHLRLHALT